MTNFYFSCIKMSGDWKVTEYICFQRNALDVMISEPNKTQDQMFVDDPAGNKQSLKGAGMVPNFVEKKVGINKLE